MDSNRHKGLKVRGDRLCYDDIPDVIDTIINQQRYRQALDPGLIAPLEYDQCAGGDNYRYRYLLLLAAWGSQNDRAMLGLMYSIFRGDWLNDGNIYYLDEDFVETVWLIGDDDVGAPDTPIDVFDLSIYKKLCDDHFKHRTILCNVHGAALSGIQHPPDNMYMFDLRFVQSTPEELHNIEMESPNPTPVFNHYIFPLLEICKGTNPYESIVFQQFIKLGLCKDNIYAGLFLSFWCKNKIGIVWFLNELNDIELQVVIRLIKSCKMLSDIINVSIGPIEDEWIHNIFSTTGSGGSGGSGDGDGGGGDGTKKSTMKSTKTSTVRTIRT